MRRGLSNLLFAVGFIMFIICAAGADTSPVRVIIAGMAISAGLVGLSILLDPSKLD